MDYALRYCRRESSSDWPKSRVCTKATSRMYWTILPPGSKVKTTSRRPERSRWQKTEKSEWRKCGTNCELSRSMQRLYADARSWRPSSFRSLPARGPPPLALPTAAQMDWTRWGSVWMLVTEPGACQVWSHVYSCHCFWSSINGLICQRTFWRDIQAA